MIVEKRSDPNKAASLVQLIINLNSPILFYFLLNGASMKLVTRIIGGKRACRGEIPYQISLQNENDIHFCGGVIINKYYVLTAAHCVSNANTSGLSVVAGTTDLQKPYSRRLVQSIFIHEEYNLPPLTNDIALLKLQKPLKFSSRICSVNLPKQNQTVKGGSIAEVSGFGIISCEGEETEHLYVVDNIITNQTCCRKLFDAAANITIEDTQICANNPTIQKGACVGDSGGPLTVNGLLVGLVSFGLYPNICTSIEYPAVYTRVSSYSDWINKNIEKI
ncbi:Mite allergen Eur m 3 [Atta colombica]|uniref:chymotrypsin n=1 Tax=Atta colombica TaxID=520822 RepID=A0A195B0M6_9HYME|nr:Mite allergen Eur m 3 [Atta colombica]